MLSTPLKLKPIYRISQPYANRPSSIYKYSAEEIPSLILLTYPSSVYSVYQQAMHCKTEPSSLLYIYMLCSQTCNRGRCSFKHCQCVCLINRYHPDL
ncbi:hypothetical protein XELAEV_18029607mg [Xenopus laevis]|uniref:Uncharacterized protein n=1 Tax=Xenopus laevis TaxID=8355 RepID=A0A974CTQ5_XENLA|nr:hypothetical protein XELAEV_18029607mg [Xenopus laevis]